MSDKHKVLSCGTDSFSPWDIGQQLQTPFFEKYLELVSSFNYSDELTTARKRVENMIGKGPSSDEYYDYLMDQYSNLEYEEFESTQLFYRSFVVSAFIFIEQNLIDYSQHLRRGHQQSFTYLDIKGDGVGRPLLYIKRVLGVDFPKDKQTKDFLNAARAVRNVIVHNDARPTDNELKYIKRVIHLYPTLLNGTNSSILISHQYAKSLVELNHELTKELKTACASLKKATL